MRRLLSFLGVVILLPALLVNPVEAASGLQTTGDDDDLDWVGGYHEPFNYDSFYDFMMNSCDGHEDSNGNWVNIARDWNDEAQEPYVGAWYHPAYDMNASNDAGMAVYAIADGTLKSYTNNSPWPGDARWITHDRGDGTTFTAVYGHIDVNLPPDRDNNTAGHQVNRGDQIGTIHNYGSSHLHFGINTGDTTASGRYDCDTWDEEEEPDLHGWVDPIDWLSDNPLVDPSSDTDGDGINDDVDDCHLEFGPPAPPPYNGCPIVEDGATASAAFDNKLYTFAIGNDGEMYFKKKEAGIVWPSGSNWSELGQPTSTDLVGDTTTAEYDGKLYLFAIGDNGKLYYSKKTPGLAWDNWESLGEPADNLSGPITAAAFDSKLYVFVIADDGKMYYLKKEAGIAWPTSWTTSLGKPTTPGFGGDITAAEYDNKLYLFGIATNGKAYYKKKDSGGVWSTNWTSLSEPPSGDLASPVTAATFDNKLYLIAIGNNGELYYKKKTAGSAWNTASTGWSELSEPTASDLVGDITTAEYDGKLYAFAVAANGKTYYRTKAPGSTWGAWQSLSEPESGDLSGPVSATAFDNKLYLFTIGDDGEMYYKKKVAGFAWPSGSTGWSELYEPPGVNF